MALILRNGGSQSPDRWLRDPRNNQLNDTGEETFGLLCFAEITEFAKELHSEMEKIVLMNELPENWTYPLIQPKLIEKYLRVKNNSIIGATVTVTVDRPLGSYHPEYKDMYYPINYGYIEGVMAPDGEEQDAYILGVNEPVGKFTGKIIAIVLNLICFFRVCSGKAIEAPIVSSFKFLK